MARGSAASSLESGGEGAGQQPTGAGGAGQISQWIWVGATAMENRNSSGLFWSIKIDDLTENGDFRHVGDVNFRIAGVTLPVHLIRAGHLVLAGGVASAGEAGPWDGMDDGMPALGPNLQISWHHWHHYYKLL